MREVEATGPSVEVRIGDPERQAGVAALGEHYSFGRLTSAEFDERLTRVLAARTAVDVARQFKDLPDVRSRRPASTVAALGYAGPRSGRL